MLETKNNKMTQRSFTIVVLAIGLLFAAADRAMAKNIVYLTIKNKSDRVVEYTLTSADDCYEDADLIQTFNYMPVNTKFTIIPFDEGQMMILYRNQSSSCTGKSGNFVLSPTVPNRDFKLEPQGFTFTNDGELSLTNVVKGYSGTLVSMGSSNDVALVAKCDTILKTDCRQSNVGSEKVFAVYYEYTIKKLPDPEIKTFWSMKALTDDEYLIKYKSGYTTNNLPRCLIINDQGTPWVTEITPSLNNIFGVDPMCDKKNRKAVWKLEARPTGEFIITNAATGYCLYATAEGKIETGRLGVSPGMMGGSARIGATEKQAAWTILRIGEQIIIKKDVEGVEKCLIVSKNGRGTLELFKWGPGELCGYPGGYKAWLEQTTYAPSN